MLVLEIDKERFSSIYIAEILNENSSIAKDGYYDDKFFVLQTATSDPNEIKYEIYVDFKHYGNYRIEDMINTYNFRRVILYIINIDTKQRRIIRAMDKGGKRVKYMDLRDKKKISGRRIVKKLW